jgi:hypothetical protein
MAPPNAIDVMRGTTPVHSAAAPSSLITCRRQSAIPLYCAEPAACVMRRVLTTSRGVVMAAAMPPATEPHSEPWSSSSSSGSKAVVSKVC